jgi:hypothetical protein
MYKSKIWDKKSPVNGNPPEAIVKAYRLESSSVVGLVYHEDSPSTVALIVCNRNWTKKDVEKMMAEQIKALDAAEAEQQKEE